MLRELIVQVAPFILAGLFVLFFLAKLYLNTATVNNNYISLFFSSLWFFNRVTIRNTFHEKLKAYYQRSNTVNKVFYAMFAVVLAVFMLMRSI